MFLQIMKRIFLLLSLFVLISGSVFAQQARALDRIQEKIDSCFIHSFSFISSFNTPYAYDDLERSLVDGYNTEKSSNIKSYYLYWLSYLTYYKSVSAFKESNFEKSQKYIEQAINYLEQIGNKDSEYYSLLAYEQVFYFQFVKRQEIFIFMHKLNNNLKLAMELDPSNPRAYFVNGYYDYYTPNKCGGKNKTEKLLLQAIKQTNSPKPFAPTWGVADSYSLLIQYYLKNGDKDKANAMFQQAIKLFPASQDILRLKKQL